MVRPVTVPLSAFGITKDEHDAKVEKSGRPFTQAAMARRRAPAEPHVPTITLTEYLIAKELGE